MVKIFAIAVLFYKIRKNLDLATHTHKTCCTVAELEIRITNWSAIIKSRNVIIDYHGFPIGNVQ